MAKTFNWTCPFCNHAATIVESNYAESQFVFNQRNKDGDLCMVTKITVCPNEKCKEYAVACFLYQARFVISAWQLLGNPILHWQLRPLSKAKPFPSYIPKPILDDYGEACLIIDLSPKASATLSRRCLQGIIRDFYGIKKGRLKDEIDELKGKIDQPTWEAIDAVRNIGNIGAHMEKDINLIVDVEPSEAELLVGLIEILLKDWYIARHERQEHLKGIVNVAQAKKDGKKKGDG